MKHMDVSLASDSHLFTVDDRIDPCATYNLPGRENSLDFICYIMNAHGGDKALHILVIEMHQTVHTVLLKSLLLTHRVSGRAAALYIEDPTLNL